jgi:iron complex outermembrane receptor protein
VRLGYDVNDKVKVGFTYRRLDSYFEYPTPYVDYDQWPAVTDPHLYNTEDKNRSNLVTGRVDAEITKLWSTSFMIGHYNMDYSTHTPGFDFQPNVMCNRRFQTEWRNALTWNKEWKTVAGMAWDRSDYMSENNYVAKDEWQSTLAFFAEQMWAPTDNFDASVALRLEHDSVWNNHFTWRYSNSWKVTGKDSPTRIFGSVGSGFRAPTYFEQYAANYGYVGNPDLDVSKSLGGDLGVEQRLADNHYASVTGFWTRINDEIGTRSVGTWPNSYTTYDNFSHATSYGVEVAFKGQFKDAWNSGYYANYTFTMPKRDSIGKYETIQMANTARHTINAEVYTSPVEKLTVGFGVTSAMGRTDYNYARLDNFFTARLFARYQVTDNVAFHVRVENLFDQNFIITNDYNFGPRQARGLGVFGGVTVEF